MLYFVIKAINSMLDYIDLFVTTPHNSENFSGVILIPPKYIESQGYITGIKRCAVDVINKIIVSKRKTFYAHIPDIYKTLKRHTQAYPRYIFLGHILFIYKTYCSKFAVSLYARINIIQSLDLDIIYDAIDI